MVKKYSFSVDAWIEIEIDGSSEDDCDEQLRTASLSDLVENGYVKNFNISEVDDSVLEKTITVRVYDIVWDVEDDSDLPNSIEITVDVYADKLHSSSERIDEIDEENAIEDELHFMYDTTPKSYKYDIIKTK